MPFNTLHFLYFFIPFLICFWLLKKKVFWQNMLIIGGSYFFYGYANYKLPIVLFIVSLFTFFAAKFIAHTQNKKLFLYSSLLLILSHLFFFKYFNWIFSVDKSHQNNWYNLVTTIGISYFSLAAYSYLVDVYRKKITAENSLITLLSYLSFFPSLLSGPIPIAFKHLPQFSEEKNITSIDVENAFQRILWGLFKKVIVSASLAQEVNYIFYNHTQVPFLFLWLGIILYSFQVYMDFSGYSDMAWGIAKLLGFNVSPNFKSPFISRSIAEFWRRWHLSLSSWLKEYIYTPLGGRGDNKLQYCLNILIIFSISGLWHGANASFVLWGLFNGVLFVVAIIFNFNNKKSDSPYTFFDVFKVVIIFISISFTRVLFRSPSFNEAITYYKLMFHFSNFKIPDIGLKAFLFSITIVIVEFLQRKRIHVADISHLPIKTRFIFYVIFIIVLITIWPVNNSTEYIYFKF